MAAITVLGGGLCGLSTALLLPRDGHEVTVWERDTGRVPASPEDAWATWDRARLLELVGAYSAP